jgi:DNA-binding IclR family transcriptional regulator
MPRQPRQSGSNPLKRAVSVVDVVAASVSGLTLHQIAHALELPQSTTHRQLQSLVAVGYLTSDPTTKAYSLGDRLRRVLQMSIGVTSLKQVARPVLVELAEQAAETAYIVRFGERVITLVDFVMPVRGSRTLVHPGYEFPVHASAAGKAIFAFRSDAELTEAVADGLEAFQKNTITDPVALRRALKKVRERGYAINDLELDPGVFAIAAPITVEGLGVISAIGIVGLHGRMADRTQVDRLAPALKVAAAEIARLMPSAVKRE